MSYGTESPIGVIINDWNDIRAGAPLGSFLNGYNDPRITHMMSPASDAAVSGQFIGIRNGVAIDAKARYEGYSKPVSESSEQAIISIKAKAWQKSRRLLKPGSREQRRPCATGPMRAICKLLMKPASIAPSEEVGSRLSGRLYKADAVSKPAPYVDPESAGGWRQ